MHETDILYSTSIAAAQVAQTFVEYYINFETNRLCLILLHSHSTVISTKWLPKIAPRSWQTFSHINIYCWTFEYSIVLSTIEMPIARIGLLHLSIGHCEYVLDINIVLENN